MSRVPSFQPWLARVRMARTVLSVLGFVAVSAIAYTGGMPPDDAALRGLGASVLCFLVGWAGSLWIASELYGMQINRLRRDLQRREEEREQQVRELYEQRMRMMGGEMDSTMTSPMSPPPGARAA